jgi:hypothetical protein
LSSICAFCEQARYRHPASGASSWRLRTKPVGSALAAARVVALSSVYRHAPRLPGIARA